MLIDFQFLIFTRKKICTQKKASNLGVGDGGLGRAAAPTQESLKIEKLGNI